MSFLSRLWSCIFTVEGFIFLLFISFAIYKIFTSRRSVYPFVGLKPKDYSNVNKDGKGESKNKTSKPEKLCKQIFEKIFGYTFHKIRPNWLINPQTRKNLELDGYCEYITTPIGQGLGFEYNGQQHSKYTPYFHKSEEDFVNQVKRDFLKEKLCRQRGIVLISIPYNIHIKDLESYIRNKLVQKGILIE